MIDIFHRDPENSPVTYSMSSLLDSRSAGMFAVDSRSGVVTTQAKLDRERLDVHYFRVVAQDDTFPPRTGTTTLQVNFYNNSSFLSSDLQWEGQPDTRREGFFGPFTDY